MFQRSSLVSERANASGVPAPYVVHLSKGTDVKRLVLRKLVRIHSSIKERPNMQPSILALFDAD